MNDLSAFESEALLYDAESAASGSAELRPIRLVVQQEPMQPPKGALMRLARLLGLDVWGESLLGRRVGGEMAAAALVLTTVLLFELFAWSMLFNVLVHAAEWEITFRTVLAVFLGCLFAAVVFIFEKSFITADFSEGLFRKLLAYGLRLLIIAGSILATSQPIELLVFGKAIEHRLHEENILAEALRQVKEIRQLKKDAETVSLGDLQKSLDNTTEFSDREEALRELKALELSLPDLRQKRSIAEQEVTDRQSRVPYWEERLKLAQTALAHAQSSDDPKDYQEAQSSIDKARRNLPVARQLLAKAKGILDQAERSLKEGQESEQILRGRAQATDGKWEELLKQQQSKKGKETEAAQEKLTRRKTWMEWLQSAPPGAVKDPASDRVLAAKAADFTDRLRVLDDLRRGEPAHWPRSRTDIRKEAEDTFSLGGEAAGPSEMGAELFNRIYWVAFIIAAVIPLLTLAFKLMMSRELRDYYSARAQARALNPEAIQALIARKAPRKEGGEG